MHQQQPPPINTPPNGSSTPQRRIGLIGFNHDYLCSLAGLIQINLIVILFPLIISVAAVPKTAYLSLPRTATENAFLFFGIVAFLLEIALFILYITSICELGAMRKIPVRFLICMKDIVLAIPLFSLSIASAVYESQQRNGTFTSSAAQTNIYDVYNYGAFASAAFFGFICTILYVIHFVFELFALITDRKALYQ